MSDSSTELARERSLTAADRTLMAWIRTALALIGFGFGIGKFYGYLRDAGLDQRLDPLRSTLIFGASFIILGMLGLLAAVIQHARVLSRIQRREYTYAAPWPLSGHGRRDPPRHRRVRVRRHPDLRSLAMTNAIPGSWQLMERRSA